MPNEESELEREGERQSVIDNLLQGIKGIDWKIVQDPAKGEILMVMESHETPVERAAGKLLEAGWEKIDARKDDSRDRCDWFTFRIPD